MKRSLRWLIQALVALTLAQAQSVAGKSAPPCDRAREKQKQSREVRGAEAVTLLIQASELCPKDDAIAAALARAYQSDRQDDKAIALATQLIERNPGNADMLFLRATIRWDRDQLAAAHEDFLLAACYGHAQAPGQARQVQKDMGVATVLFVGVCPDDVMSAEQLRELVLNAKPLVRQTVSFRNINFESGQAILATIGQRQLDEITRALRSINLASRQHLVITGHADQRPFRDQTTAESNRRNCVLSWDRARAVADHLAKSLDWAQDQITVIGRGNDQLLDPELTDAAHQRNRRVDLWYGAATADTSGCAR